MALFRVQIFKTQNDVRFWTNVYHVDAIDILAARAFASAVIAPGECTMMLDLFRVVKIIVSDPATDDFTSIPTNIPGGVSETSYLPLFNTAKVNVSVAGLGRPDYKFYRGGLWEGNTEEGSLDAGTVASYSAMVGDLIADGTAAGVDLVDDAGNLWTVASCQTPIQMRQLHRRRKRVTEPI